MSDDIGCNKMANLTNEKIMTMVENFESDEIGMVEITEILQDEGYDMNQIADVLECCDWL